VNRRLFLSLAALAAAGCGGGEGSGGSTTGPAEPGLNALLVGRLYGNAERRCVWVGTRESGTQVAWPKRYRVEFDPVRIVEAAGRDVRAREGDWIRMGGGFVDTLPSDPECAGGDEPGAWMPAGAIDFLDGKRPPEAPPNG
jgi:hypothetical protein